METVRSLFEEQFDTQVDEHDYPVSFGKIVNSFERSGSVRFPIFCALATLDDDSGSVLVYPDEPQTTEDIRIETEQEFGSSASTTIIGQVNITADEKRASGELELSGNEEAAATMLTLSQEVDSHEAPLLTLQYDIISQTSVESAEDNDNAPMDAMIEEIVEETVSDVEDDNSLTKTETRRKSCEICEKDLSLKYYKTHMQIIHGVGAPVKRNSTDMSSCVICNKTFTTRRGLAMHKQTHMPVEERTMERKHCSICNKFFRIKYYYTHRKVQHGLGKTPIKPGLQCSMCDKVCGNARRLRDHEWCHKPIEERRAYECPTCKKMYATQYDLKKHIRIHTDLRLFVCELCGQQFKTAESLKHHTVIHSDAHPHTCDICGKSFKRITDRNVHVRITHEKVPRYKCDYCDRTFVENGTRLIHHRTHTGEAPYVCHLCGKTSKQRSNLKSHLRHMHKIRNPKLEPCNRINTEVKRSN